MPTAQTLIISSLRKLGTLGVGETPDTTELTECLGVLNQLLGTLRLHDLFAYQIQAAEKAVSAGTASLTVGATGTWGIERPVDFEWLQWSQDSVVRDISRVDRQRFSVESSIAAEAWPGIYHYDAGYPLATLYLYPTPDVAGTLIGGIRSAITADATLSTNLSLPPGYERAIVLMLACDLAPDYQLAASPYLLSAAQEAFGAIKRTNEAIPELKVLPGLSSSGPRTRIFEG